MPHSIVIVARVSAVALMLAVASSAWAEPGHPPVPAPEGTEPAPTVAEPAPTVAEPAPTVAEPAPTVAEPAPTVAIPLPYATLIERARAASKKGDTRVAIALWERARALKPSDREALSKLCAAYQSVGDMAAAKAACGAWLALDPDDPNARRAVDRLGAGPAR